MNSDAKLLLYDDYCPLCTWYSGLFVKFRFLRPENRIPFSTAGPGIMAAIDLEKGRDEIPLFDPDTKTAVYGIDALLEILGRQAPFIQLVGNKPPIKWTLKLFYKIISYNRKVIVARKCGQGLFDCSPGFNIFYRSLFMVVFLILNSLMLWPVHDHVLTHLSFYHLNFAQLQAAHLTFVAANCLVATSLTREQAIEFLGQINMLAVITTLLLMPAVVAGGLVAAMQPIIILYLVILTAFITREYFRRMNYANMVFKHRRIIIFNLFCLVAFLAYVFH